MDKKELVKYINTISNTGPGGVDKIKEVLKKLVKEGLDGGSGSDDSDDGGSSSDGGCNCDLSDYVKLSDLIPTIEIDFNSPDETEENNAFWEGDFNGNRDIVSAIILKDTSSSKTVYCRITYSVHDNQVETFYSDKNQYWIVQLGNSFYEVMCVATEN